MTKTGGEKYVKRGADNMRRAAEGAFSTFKLIFGEHALSLTRESIIQEIRLKVAQYSKRRDESTARELERGVWHTRHEGQAAARPKSQAGMHAHMIGT